MSSKTSDAGAGDRRYLYAVAALTALALVVRIPGLGSGLWADEIWAVMESFRTPFPQSLAHFPGDNKHPLYAVLAHASIVTFGEHAWSVRLPALLFGVATVPLLYALGVSIASRAEAFAAAALLALSYHHVWFSQNARGYTMLAFWAVLTTLLLVRAMRGQNAPPWVWYGIAAALGAYTHLTFVFTVLAQAAVALLGVLAIPRSEGRLSWRGPLIGFFVAAVVSVLLYAPIFAQVMSFFLHRKSNLEGISSPGWALAEGLRVLRLGFGGLFGAGVVAVAIAVVVGCAGIISYTRQSLRVMLLLVLPALFTLLGAFVARGTMYPRFFFGLIGFALLLGMRGAFVAGAWIAQRADLPQSTGRAVGVAVASIVVVASALSVPLDWRSPKQDFEGAMRFAESSVPAGEVIATADVTALIYGPFFHRTWPVVRNGAELEAMRSRSPVWLIYTFPRYLMKYDPTLASTVDRECRSARRFRGTIGGGDVIVCRLGNT